MQKYSNCFLGVKKGCKSRNCLIYTLYCGERGIRKAKPSRGHISKNNPYLATQPPVRENPLEKAAAGIAAFCCGTERPSCCSDDLLETKKATDKSLSLQPLSARGERGIRTPGTVTRTPHFECGPIDHSGISPICSDSFSPFTFRPPRFPFSPTRLPQG